MVIQPLIMLLEGESSNIFYCLPSASPRAVNHPTKQASFKPNWVQNNKKERENGPQYIAALLTLICVT